MFRKSWTLLRLCALLCAAGIVSTAHAQQQQDPLDTSQAFICPSSGPLCTDINSERYEALVGQYTGHDEPAILFYSNRRGAGNNLTTVLTLPTDPPALPQQDGTGGTFNFQLHPAFWFGMVLCDSQSSPNFTHVCNPNTDANIFENPDPNSNRFVGHHPGSAVLELQFYPPGGLNTCSSPTLWCVAMTIDSLNIQDLTNLANNIDCQRRVGLEPVNFAFLTTTGASQSAADPLNPDRAHKFGVFSGTTFQMNPGDRLEVIIHDTPAGLQAIVHDLTQGTTGSMTASVKNGFAQVNFVPDPDPNNPSVTCTSSPYAFHPMYATSSERTRATWAAHTINNSFSDEIGHYELCPVVQNGRCLAASADDPGGVDADSRNGCVSATVLAARGLQPIGACRGQDTDFDGADYQFKWPGTGPAATDAEFHASPIRFTSPKFHHTDRDANDADDQHGELHDFSRVAFETDLPIIQSASNPACDVLTGNGCTNPPNGAQFYPIYSTFRAHGHDDDDDGACSWQLGGPNIPGTINNFGGTSTSEYGGGFPLLVILPIDATHPNGSSTTIVADFRTIHRNPCRRGEHNGDHD